MYEQSFHYLLMATHMTFQKKFLSSIKSYGLTVGQPKILDHLYYHNGISQKELAFGCHIEPASLTSLLNRMEKDKLIERRILNGNRRTFYIFLTDRGMEIAKQVTTAFLPLEEQIFDGISDEERSKFLETFWKLYKNITNEEK